MAIGDITEIDSIEHDTARGTDNSMVQIDATHYILAYRGTSSSTGNIATFSIDGASDNITELDSLEYNSSSGGSKASLVKIDDTHFILSVGILGGDDIGANLITFSIDGSFNITEIATLVHDTSGIGGEQTSLVKIDATHFALAYTTSGNDGNIKTFSIDGSYENITELAVLEHDGSGGIGGYESMVLIDSTHLILAYGGSGFDGFMKTFSFDGSYLNITQIDVLEHDTSFGIHNSLVKIDATHFALAYTSDGSDGKIKTFSIDGSFDTITEIDALEHETSNNDFNSLVLIDATHFALAYAGNGDDGFIKTFSIDGSFDNITQLDSLEHDTSNGEYNSLVLIDSTHVILAYAGSGDDGFITTFGIEGGVVDTGNFLSLF